MLNKKIVIEITDPHKPPVVMINGKNVKVKEINYYFDGETDVTHSTHDLLMSVANKEKNHFDKIGFEM